MTAISHSEPALVLFSGGQDSTTCLAWALARFPLVETIGFDYGQRHRVELECRGRIAERLRREFPELARPARRRPPDRSRRARPDQRHRPDPRQRDPVRAKRLAEHLRARPQPAVLHLRGGIGLSARHQASGRRHVRDRLFGLSRLPRRHAEITAGDAVARHGSSLCDPYAADVARQGGDLGARAGPRRREAGRADPRGDAQLLQRRPRAPPRLGLWLRRLPGLRPAP